MLYAFFRKHIIGTLLAISYKAPGKPHISLYPEDEEDIDLEYLRKLHDGSRYGQYLSLFEDFVHKDGLGLTGGIGNLYVKHDLWSSLGPPIEREKHTFDSGSYSTPHYTLILGVPRNPNHNCKSWGRDVIELLYHNGNTQAGRYKAIQIRVDKNIFHVGKCRW